MGRRIIVLTVALLCVIALTSAALAGGDTKLKYKGVYTAWAQSQHDFWLGNDKKPEYDDNYAVQMLRMMLDFEAAEGVHAVTRFDMALPPAMPCDHTPSRRNQHGGCRCSGYWAMQADSRPLRHDQMVVGQHDRRVHTCKRLV